MKYSEFKVEVEKMGLNMDSIEHRVFVRRKSGETVFTISKSVENFADCGWASYLGTLNDGQRGQLFDLAYQLAKTPLAEREEEKRYWLWKLPVPLLDRSEEKKWLWRQRGTDIVGVDTLRVDHEKYQTIFTESEIAEMDITGFEKIEVEE